MKIYKTASTKISTSSYSFGWAQVLCEGCG
jgi:hypothetical protein